MSKFSWIFLLAVLSACGGGGGEQAAAAQPVPVATTEPVVQPLQAYLFMGQSNMSGVIAAVADLPPELQAPQRAVAWQNSGTWAPLQPPNMEYNGGGDGIFGPEISFAYRKGPIAIVKYAVGGTSLHTQWIPPGGLLDRAIARAKAASAGDRPIQWAGMVWLQGGSDMDTIEKAGSYRADLQALASRVRTALGAPDMQLIVGRDNSIVGSIPFKSMVREAQQTPGIANYQYIDIDDLPFSPTDAAHYVTSTLMVIGDRFAAVAP